MKQIKQGVRSTKVIDEDAMLKAEAIPQPKPGVKHKDVYLRVFDTTKKAWLLPNHFCPRTQVHDGGSQIRWQYH
jgi:hypothetical protein